ncbi:unnamed protein product [Hermetia illucens]|uniref:Uncharacterized protein n=1 Tax=Hermetia illucens TaxID=343691 RepID=A0A7R8V2Z4_HERIL|nr:unnamed protein product [Hermetia illucens]
MASDVAGHGAAPRKHCPVLRCAASPALPSVEPSAKAPQMEAQTTPPIIEFETGAARTNDRPCVAVRDSPWDRRRGGVASQEHSIIIVRSTHTRLLGAEQAKSEHCNRRP